jgi:hypothetical protein
MRHPPGEAVAALVQEMLATHTLATSIRPAARGVNHTGSEKRRRTALTVMVLAFVGLTGCTSAALPPEPVIETADDLQAALEQAGHPLEPTALGAAVDGLIGGRRYILDGSYLDVFEYESALTQQAAEQDLMSSASGVAWGRGKILVVYHGTDGGSIALLSGFLGDPLTLSDEVVDQPYPPAVPAAIAFLAEDLGEDPGRIVVVEYEATEWPDACLGLGRPSETCAEVVTAGWRIVLQLDSTTYALRSDAYGQMVRRE